MVEQRAFDTLCEYCGIQSDYYDIWGNRHVASSDVKLRLLRAMGVPVTSEENAGPLLAQLQAQEWRRVVAPTKVLFEDETVVHLSLSLAAVPSLNSCEWEIELENGERRRGVFLSPQTAASCTLDGIVYTHYDIAIPAALPLGYHRFHLRLLSPRKADVAVVQLIVCPRRCYQPPTLDGGGRTWGLNVQLYALRSARNWGIGDFTDLKKLVEISAQLGGGMVGVNPLHALFPEHPNQASPYSPSNRAALNVLYIDVEAVEDFAEAEAAQALVQSAPFQSLLQALRAAPLVDYAGVAGAKFEILEILYRHFRETHLARGSERARAFRTFQNQSDDGMRNNAVFDALHEHFRAQDPSITGWHQWPTAFHNPKSLAVGAFCATHRERIEYFDYIQWQAQHQFATVSAKCDNLNLEVGLYCDLAIGADGGGAEIWMQADLYATTARVGAPSDEFNPKGQDWGLPPLIPIRLSDAGYTPFVTTLRAAMREAGALRIDHIMGLMRLFWIPAGTGACDGAYVRYPMTDLMAILALESQRHRCLIVGEDLGTVPDPVRVAMDNFNIFSYRLFYFERVQGDEFAPPECYPSNALVAVATHDLPPLRAYWTGEDLAIRERLGLYPNDEIRNRQHASRVYDRERIMRALEGSGLMTVGLRNHGTAVHAAPPALAHAIHAYLSRSPAKLLSVQPEDVFEEAAQVNVPNTVDQYPNWRHKIDLLLEEWQDDSRLRALADELRGGDRGRSPFFA